ncbi:hypothetical protein [Thermococcus peptonophilus]|uniref:Uncharacterized protein n=1 Tax=Thermococcus peptonophilus TaxID=53952 RepID=A0A142CWJ0_9EURY|nr:hypothetical protein [Thermococcus peptonophilus]AMQ19142.1 hypothetical protein A0127_08185 [Thermococcus peptonophilus]
MKGSRVVLAVLIIGLVILGGYLYTTTRAKEHSPEIDTTRAQILAYLGGLDCYSYQENITTTIGNETTESTINGGRIYGTYYFEGQRSGLHWYAVIINNTLKERIITNETTKDVNITLSKDGKALSLSVDPVKIGLQAVGAGKLVEKGKNNITYTFDITVPPSLNIEMNGTVTVFWDGERVTRLMFNVEVGTQGRQTEKRTIIAIIREECRKPEWFKKVLR